MEQKLTTISVLTALVVLALSIVYWRIRKAYKFFSEKGISGPKPTFPLGTWNSSSRKFVGEEDVKNIEKFGSIVGTFDGLKPNVLITDLQLISKVLRNEDTNLRSKRAQSAQNGRLRRILQLLEDDYDNKDIASFLISPNNNNKLRKLLPRLETSTNGLIRSLTLPREDKEVFVNDIIADWVEDTTALALLGLDLNADPVFRQRFIKQSKNLFALSNTSSVISAIPVIYGGVESWISLHAIEYFKSIVSSEIRERSGQESVESKAADLIDILLDVAAEEKKTATKEKAQDLSEEQLELLVTHEVITDVVLAALLVIQQYTRSNVLFGILALAQNPDVQDKLYEELKRANLEKSHPETIDKLPYLNAFTKEVIRRYPAEFRLEKVATEEFALTESQSFAKGTIISIPVFALHTSKLFHTDPDTFSPERFLSGTYEGDNPFFHLPASKNIVTALSNLATKIALAKLVTKLTFSEPEGFKNEPYKTGLIHVPLPGNIKVVCESR